MASNMFSEMNLPSAKTIISTAASLAASAMVIRSITHELIPSSLQLYIFTTIEGFFKSHSSEIVLIIEEFDGLVTNQIYTSAEIYLGTKISPFMRLFKVSMPEKENKITTTMVDNQQIMDEFNGVMFKWRKITRQIESKRVGYMGQSSTTQTENRLFTLCFHKKHKQMVFDSYIPFILKESKNVKEEKKTLKIHTLHNDQMRRYSGNDHSWSSITLDHPANFDTLAMDSELKKMIMDDLEKFVKRKDFYRKVGKAWKRGYLLDGPPGTGKSSLIAAMANYLNFDVYDLELTDLQSNSDLRRLLIGTANRSILVVEDIDCSLELDDRKAEERAFKTLRSSQVQTINIIRQHKPNQQFKLSRVTITGTLSGLLNFIDGLWSSCGDERIIVFTTNHKERIDPALLRPGRMDVHIHMSYCTPCAFKTLASNYLGITDDSLFPIINDLMEKTMVTPAEIGEQLMRNEEPGIALEGLIEYLQKKKRESEEIEARKARELEEQKDGAEVGTEERFSGVKV